MSLNVQSVTVNSTTDSPHDESTRSPLTPGQIAIITIGTSFAFFISIMFIICLGEFVQYNKRKKIAAARKKNSAGGTSYNYDSDVRSGSQFESSQSDYTSSFLARQTMSIEPVPSTSKIKDGPQVKDISIPSLPRHSITNEGVVTLPFNKSLNDVQIDCDNSCENGNNDIVLLPLIGKQCDDILDIDGEIFCDSPESRDMYHLEADV